MISIVDDDVFVRSATENLLVSLGYDVVTFASAEEFLTSGQADYTSCLITDVAMPGLTGLDLQRRLIDDGKCVPIIFMTGYFSQRTRAQALAGGAAFQIGIVLCSAAVITGIVLLAWLAGGIAVIGVAFMGLGLFAPHALHLA